MKNQNRWLLALICLFLILSACSPIVTPPRLTAMIPDKTSTAVPFTPTNSLTVFPEATEIPFVMPTATFMAPTPVAGLRYRLTRWTPQFANNLIEALRKYPDHLGEMDRGYHDFGYYHSYEFAVFAERETRLYFPNPSFGEAWAWDASYNMAQYGDRDALESYANLIGPALNNGKATINRLADWFKTHETRLNLTVTPMKTKPESYVLEIADVSESFGGFLWAVRNGTAFSIYPLPGKRPAGYGDFEATSSVGVSFDLKDVTGDGVAEIITTHQHFPGSGDALTTAFDVFDISSGTPTKLEFDPELSSGHERKWFVLDENNGFTFDFIFDRLICPVPIHYEYRWDGNKFAQTLQKYPSKQEIEAQYGDKCLDAFGSYQFLDDLHSGSASALQTWDDFLSDWPHTDPIWDFEDKKFPEASRDKARFTAAIQLASDGFVDAARHEMSLIVEKPVVPNSSWIDPAKIFLTNFKTQADMRQTCLAIQLCAQFMDTDELISLAGTEQPQDIINFLQQAGMTIGDSGSMDINNDGQMDQWIIMDPKANQPPTGWMFVSSKNGYQRVLLDYGVKSLKFEPAFQNSPVFQLEKSYGDGSSDVEVYILETDPQTSTMDFFPLCASLLSDAYSLQKNLLNGEHPSDTIKKLLPTLPDIELRCKDYRDSIAQARYMLAVAYDLSGDAKHAAENYRIVWQSYPDAGPYSLMAQAKLEVAP